MDFFRHDQGQLWCEGVPLAAIADRVGTPTYVYSASTVRHHLAAIRDAFQAVNPLICYAVKANGNLALLRLLREAGTGFDIVSVGELHRALLAGADPRQIVFSGVGKTDSEMRVALEAGILMFNIESEAEAEILGGVAASLDVVADVAIRVNPDVDPQTHRYISTGQRETKFGVDIERGAALAHEVARSTSLRLVGIHCHIGSQITSVAPYERAVARIAELATTLRKDIPSIEWLNMGGGYGIYYKDGAAPSMQEYADAVVPLVEPTGLRLIMEPGRIIVGNAGVLITQVILTKQAGDRRFVIVDAGMNDVIRPSLYEGYHRIWPVKGDAPPSLGDEGGYPPCNIVGPVCETGDFLAKDRPLPDVDRGDLLAIMSAGAYGFVMASNYNDRCRPPEVLVDGDRMAVVRERESFDDLVRYDRPDAPFEQVT